MLPQKVKREMTSFDLAAVVYELKEIIVGCKVENIYQINFNTLLFSLYPQQKLMIEAGKRIHLTKYNVEKPPSPPIFCQNLRKNLRGGIIKEIKMEGFERVVTIEVSTKETSYKFVSELFGGGNFILLNNLNQILYALSYRRMKDRNIIKGEIYKLPPIKGLNPLDITREQLEILKEKPAVIIKALTSLLSIGGLYATEVLSRADIDKKTETNKLSNYELDKIYNTLNDISFDLIQRRQFQIVLDTDEKWIDVLPFSISLYKGLKIIEFSTFNEALDEYFTKLKLEEKGIENLGEIEQQLDEQKRILLQQKSHLQELIKKSEEYQLIGNTINMHLPELQNLIEFISEKKRSGEEWDQIILTSKNNEPLRYLNSIDLIRKVALITLGDIKFELNYRENVYKNAARFYEAIKEAKTKIEGLNEAISETEKKIEKRQKMKDETEKQKIEITKIRQRYWFEKFHWVYSSENFLIIGGRDATTNELLIKRYMSPNDIVLHADFAGAPFVLIKTNGNIISEQTLYEAAQLAAAYSKAWREGISSLDVYWVNPDQISKGTPSGEYLSKGMFMIYGQKNYLRAIALNIGIGVARRNNDLIVIGGPVKAIIHQTPYIVEVIPGKQSSGKLAKEIRYKLAEQAQYDLRERILKLPLDDIQRFIPAGGACLV